MLIKLLVSFFILLITFTGTTFAATLLLEPQTITLNAQDTTTLNLILNPQGNQVIGTDIFLSYSSPDIQVVAVENKNIFPSMPGLSINNQVGLTKFSLIHHYGQSISNTATIATITIKALRSQADHSITFLHVPGKTNDTNVAIAGGRDVLTTATGVTITTPKNSATPPTSLTSTPSPSPIQSPSSTPTPSPTLPLPFLTSAPLPPGFISPLGDSDSTPPPAHNTSPQVLGDTTNNIIPRNTQSFSFNPWIIPFAFMISGITLLIVAYKKHREDSYGYI